MKEHIIVLRISGKLQKAGEYYLVDWDFPLEGRDETKRHKFFRDLRKLLGGPVSEHTATTSVFLDYDQSKAEEVYKLAVEAGAVVNLRKAQTVKSSVLEEKIQKV